MLPAADTLFDDARALHRVGGFDPLLNTGRVIGVAQWGPGVAAAVAASAFRFPRRTAIVDEAGSTTYRSLDRKATNLAGFLRRRAGKGSVGLMCRNHSGFVIGQVAAERAGLDLVLVSTALPAPKLREVLEREKIAVLIADEEFRPLIDQSGIDAFVLSADGTGPDSLAEQTAIRRLCTPPTRRSRLVLLTSGTTGPPKGARRANRAPRPSDLGLITQIPYRLGDTYYIAPPLFHAWGLSQSTCALSTGSTIILHRKFDVGRAVQLLATEQIDVLAVVPLMLRRILNAVVDGDLDIKPPRIVASSGNVLSGSLATEWMDRFGDHLYNLYGSTEAAVGTIASPADLRTSPGTVGRPPRGVTLSILDSQGMPMPIGKSGRVFLSSSMQFASYTDGSDGDRSGTMLATGDLGYIDSSGLLHVRGRANDMIVTGGENVFPSRVEEVLDQHRDVEISAVVGVHDEEYGQRVVAFVVPTPGRTIDIDDLRATAASEMQSFMVPREFVVVDALPMTTTGKVIRHRLAVLGNPKHV